MGYLNLTAELFAMKPESGTPTVRSKIKRKPFSLVEHVRGVDCTWSQIIREVMALVCVGVRGWGGLESGRELCDALVSPFPGLPVLFPPRLQQLDLVERLCCSDLNSSYSPQKTLASASQPFAPSLQPLSAQQAYALFVFETSFLYLRKLCLEKHYPISSCNPSRVELQGTVTEALILAGWLAAIGKTASNLYLICVKMKHFEQLCWCVYQTAVVWILYIMVYCFTSLVSGEIRGAASTSTDIKTYLALV